MRPSRLTLSTLGLVCAASVAAAAPGAATPDRGGSGPAQHGQHGQHGRHGQQTWPEVRVATFNASLNRSRAGELVEDLSSPDDEQARNVAETIQRVDPDVVLVNEFDYDPEAVDLFRRHYLEVGQRGARPVRYPYAFVAPVNTGVPSGHDLDNDGQVGGPGDAYGFGTYPGQYGMVVLSKHPIDTRGARTFRTFRWADMPGARLPDDPATAAPHDWYSAAELEDVRLSSKSHWDLPVRVGRRTIHVLASHPTPPVFDGPEDRNGTRNADEIRFWADYVAGGRRARYVYDDDGRRGGLPRHARFVIAGDLNSDPYDGDSLPGAAQQVLDSPRVDARRTPRSAGGPEAARLQGGANTTHRSDPAYDTADFADSAPGNLRADYVLPSRNLQLRGSGVFWPTTDSPLYRLTGAYPFPTSDHRLVWVDLR